MTDKEFCKLDSTFYGEEVDHIKQISLRTFNGKELKEYVEHYINSEIDKLTDEVIKEMTRKILKSPIYSARQLVEMAEMIRQFYKSNK